MRNRIKKAAQATAEVLARAARAVGFMLTTYLVGASAIALFAATYELRYALPVIGIASLGLFLLDVRMLRRRARS